MPSMFIITITAIFKTNLFYLVLFLSLCNVKAPGIRQGRSSSDEQFL